MAVAIQKDTDGHSGQISNDSATPKSGATEK
jgi:hypothetical protein